MNQTPTNPGKPSNNYKTSPAKRNLLQTNDNLNPKSTVLQSVSYDRAPTELDIDYYVGTIWFDTSVMPYTVYIYQGFRNGAEVGSYIANWMQIKQTTASDIFIASFLFKNSISSISKTPELGTFVFEAGNNITFEDLTASNAIKISSAIGDFVVFKINNTDEVQYTQQEKFINFEPGNGIQISKTATNALRFDSTVIVPFDEYIKTIETPNGSATTLNNVIQFEASESDGLTASASGNVFTVSVLETFTLIAKFKPNGNYSQGQIVIDNNICYVALGNSNNTATVINNPLFKKVKDSTFNYNLDNGTAFSFNGLIEFKSTDKKVLSIEGETNPTNIINFKIDALKTLKDSNGDEVKKDSDSCIQLIALNGEFVSEGTGVLKLNNPLPPGGTGMDGLKDQDNTSTTLDSDFKVKLTRTSAEYNGTDLVNDISVKVDPAVTSTMQLALINPLKYISNGSTIDYKFARANDRKAIILVSPDNSININFPVNNPNTIQLTINVNPQNVTKIADAQDEPAVADNGVVTLTNKYDADPPTLQPQISIVKDVNKPSNIVFKLLITWISSVLAQDGAVVSPDLTNRRISIVGENTTGIRIETRRDTTDTSKLILSVVGLPVFNQSIMCTGAVGIIGYNYNEATRTFTVTSGTFNFEQSNGTQITVSVTTPMSLTNNTPGISFLYVQLLGIGSNYTLGLFHTTIYSDSDQRLYCLLGQFSYVVTSPNDPQQTYFNVQIRLATDSNLSLDYATGTGARITNFNGLGSGYGLIWSRTPSTSPTIAQIDSTSGTILFPYKNSKNSQFFSPNKVPVNNGGTAITIRYYYYNSQTNVFVFIENRNTLNLTQYWNQNLNGGAGGLATITNNQYCACNYYMVYDIVNPNNSYWVAVLSSFQTAVSQDYALYLASEANRLKTFTLPNILSQNIFYRGRYAWQKTNLTSADTLEILNNDPTNVATYGSGSPAFSPTPVTYDIPKRGPINVVTFALSNLNKTITINAGQGYINGTIVNYGSIIITPPIPAANTVRKYIVSVDASNISYLNNVDTSTVYEEYYQTRLMLLQFWMNSIDGIYNVSTFQNTKVELSKETLNAFKLQASKISIIANLIQPLPGDLLSITSTNIKIAHSVFYDLFEPWSQTNINRYIFSVNAQALLPFPVIPSDDLWRASIIFITNCEERPNVTLRNVNGVRIGKEKLNSKFFKIINDKLCYLNDKGKTIAYIDVNPFVYGKNTGFTHEVFFNSNGFDNAGDCKENITQLFNLYYQFFVDSMSIKYCFYLGAALVDEQDVRLDGRAIGSNRVFKTDDGKTTVTL